ncbi:MAG: hypothetical protein HYS38_06380 [Acidobacteria bacterium]|nr:hypothetical protein [Acidobacteriota bacterium]
MTLQQLLAVLLSVALVNPLPLSAASVDTNSPRSTLGSITANGSVRVGEIQVLKMSTLFSGDQVQTGLGNAVVQYKEGPRVSLGSESAASFSSSEIQLQKGQMAFETAGTPVIFAASTLRLEPTSEKSVANVTVQDKLASISVSQGSVRVMDPSGEQLAALNAGDARLFEKAAPPPPPAAPAAAPQAGAAGGRTWLIALGVGIVGTTLGIAGLVRANNASDDADAATAEAAAAKTLAQSFSAQITALQASNAALTTQATSLSTQITALNTFATAQKAANVSLQQLEAAQNDVSKIQAELSDITNQIDALQTNILAGSTSLTSQGASPQITPEQLALLQALQVRQKGVVTSLQTATTKANTVLTDVIAKLSTAAK